jgi:hypothetical protein
MTEPYRGPATVLGRRDGAGCTSALLGMIMVVPLTMGLSCCVCQTPGRSGLGCCCALTRHERRTSLGDVRSVTCARPGSGRRRLSCLRGTVVADSDGCKVAGHAISALLLGSRAEARLTVLDAELGDLRVGVTTRTSSIVPMSAPFR